MSSELLERMKRTNEVFDCWQKMGAHLRYLGQTHGLSRDANLWEGETNLFFNSKFIFKKV